MRTKILSLLLCVMAAINANAQTLPDVAIAEGPFGANWASLSNWECPDWFRDAKFGIWAHWGPQCQAEDGDWYARHMYFPGQSQYNYHVSNFGDPSVYTLTALRGAWETYQTEGFTDGGELTDNSGTDITEEKLIETESD